MAIRDEIAALYETILKRPADEAGLNYFTNAVTSGAGTLADVARDMRASSEAQGLLGGGAATTTTNNAAVTTNAGTSGLLGGNVSNAATARGMDAGAAKSFVGNLYNTMFYRPADAGGAAFWEDALVSGRMTPADVQAAFANSPEGRGVQIGTRQVPFGSQAVGGNVYQMAQYNAPRNLPPSIQSAFQQSLDYQAALPYMIPQFNPADIPATYQQIAQPRQRLDISNITVPEWLKEAAKKDQAAATEEGAETAPVVEKAVDKAVTTGGITTTNVGGSTFDLSKVPSWIVNTYASALGRPPEQAGAEYWEKQANAGVPVSDLIATIQGSPEAQLRAGLLGK